MKNYFEFPLTKKVLEHMYKTNKKPLQILAASNYIIDIMRNPNILSVSLKVCEYEILLIKNRYRNILQVKVELPQSFEV